MEKYGSGQGVRSLRILEIRIWSVLLSFLRTVYVDDHRTEYPLAAEVVKTSCYLDDFMPSVETVETAKEMRQQLTKLGDIAGLHIPKWISQKLEVITDIPEDDRETKVDLEKKEFPVPKTLVGSRVDCSRRQVLIFLCSTLRRIGINKEERALRKLPQFMTLLDF